MDLVGKGFRLKETHKKKMFINWGLFLDLRNVRERFLRVFHILSGFEYCNFTSLLLYKTAKANLISIREFPFRQKPRFLMEFYM